MAILALVADVDGVSSMAQFLQMRLSGLLSSVAAAVLADLEGLGHLLGHPGPDGCCFGVSWAVRRGIEPRLGVSRIEGCECVSMASERAVGMGVDGVLLLVVGSGRRRGLSCECLGDGVDCVLKNGG